MLKACSNLVGGRVQSGDNLDRLEWTAQASLHIAKAQSEAEICGRFGGGSDRNRALLGNKEQFHARYANRAMPRKHWRLRISLIWRVGT